jgi:hypothetical protein
MIEDRDFFFSKDSKNVLYISDRQAYVRHLSLSGNYKEPHVAKWVFIGYTVRKLEVFSSLSTYIP